MRHAYEISLVAGIRLRPLLEALLAVCGVYVVVGVLGSG